MTDPFRDRKGYVGGDQGSGSSGKSNDELYVILYNEDIWPIYRGLESAYLADNIKTIHR